mgnify:CR=1 FL=1
MLGKQNYRSTYPNQHKTACSNTLTTLMLHRIKRANDMHQGKWNGLGGKFEPGESPEACAIREVYEESGLRIRRPELRGILTFPDFRAGEDWYAFVFVAQDFHGELIDSAEGVLQWIDDADLLDLPLWEQAAKLVRRWPEIEREAASAEAGAMVEIPVSPAAAFRKLGR